MGEQGGLLRLPQGANILLRRMAVAEGTLSQTLGRTPTLAEVAREVRLLMAQVTVSLKAGCVFAAVGCLVIYLVQSRCTGAWVASVAQSLFMTSRPLLQQT